MSCFRLTVFLHSALSARVCVQPSSIPCCGATLLHFYMHATPHASGNLSLSSLSLWSLLHQPSIIHNLGWIIFPVSSSFFFFFLSVPRAVLAESLFSSVFVFDIIMFALKDVKQNWRFLQGGKKKRGADIQFWFLLHINPSESWGTKVMKSSFLHYL